MNNLENPIGEHILTLRKSKKLNQEAFGELIEVSKAAVSSFEKGTSKPSIDTLVKIAGKFKVSLDWMVGLTEQNGGEIIQRTDFALRTDKKHDEQTVPLYDVVAAAGLATLYNSPNNIIDYITIPNLPKCDGAIKVAGDSMYPLLKSGDIVAFKKVSTIQGILFGEMYVLDVILEDGDDPLITVKFVQKSELGPEYIKLVSQNQHHGDKDVHWSQVRAIGFIKASIRINSIS